MKKTRADAKLLNLPEPQQAALAEMLLGGMPYHIAREVAAKPPPDGFGVRVSLSAFTPFWQEVCVPHLLARRSRALTAANAIGTAAAGSGKRFDAAFIDGLKQRAVEIFLQPNPEPDEIAAVVGQALKAQDMELKREQIALARDKFEFDAAAAALKELPALRAIAQDNGLDDGAKLQAVRQRLFGDLPK